MFQLKIATFHTFWLHLRYVYPVTGHLSPMRAFGQPAVTMSDPTRVSARVSASPQLNSPAPRRVSRHYCQAEVCLRRHDTCPPWCAHENTSVNRHVIRSATCFSRASNLHTSPQLNSSAPLLKTTCRLKQASAWQHYGNSEGRPHAHGVGQWNLLLPNSYRIYRLYFGYSFIQW